MQPLSYGYSLLSFSVVKGTTFKVFSYPLLCCAQYEEKIKITQYTAVTATLGPFLSPFLITLLSLVSRTNGTYVVHLKSTFIFHASCYILNLFFIFYFFADLPTLVALQAEALRWRGGGSRVQAPLHPPQAVGPALQDEQLRTQGQPLPARCEWSDFLFFFMKPQPGSVLRSRVGKRFYSSSPPEDPIRGRQPRHTLLFVLFSCCCK